jgi:hypothetical protein
MPEFIDFLGSDYYGLTIGRRNDEHNRVHCRIGDIVHLYSNERRSNLGWASAVMTDAYRAFPQRTYAKIQYCSKPRPLPATSCPIPYSPVFLPFDVIVRDTGGVMK